MHVRKLAVVMTLSLSVMAVGMTWQLSRMSMVSMPTSGVPGAQQATATPLPTWSAQLSAITPVAVSTYDPSLPTPYFINSEALAIQFAKELTETNDWSEYLVRRTNLQAYLDYFVLGVSTPVLHGDDLIWIVIFENTELMAVWQAAGHSGPAARSDYGDELGIPGGYVAFLAFDDYGNVFGGGFLDKVHADGSMKYDPGDWKTRFAAKIPEFSP